MRTLRVELALIVGTVIFCIWCAYIIINMSSSVSSTLSRQVADNSTSFKQHHQADHQYLAAAAVAAPNYLHSRPPRVELAASSLRAPYSAPVQELNRWPVGEPAVGAGANPDAHVQVDDEEEPQDEEEAEDDGRPQREYEERSGRRSFSESQADANERDKEGRLISTHRRHLINGKPAAAAAVPGAEGAPPSAGSVIDFDKLVTEIDEEEPGGGGGGAEQSEYEEEPSESRARSEQAAPAKRSQEAPELRQSHKHKLRESLSAQQWDDQAADSQPNEPADKSGGAPVANDEEEEEEEDETGDVEAPDEEQQHAAPFMNSRRRRRSLNSIQLEPEKKSGGGGAEGIASTNNANKLIAIGSTNRPIAGSYSTPTEAAENDNTHTHNKSLGVLGNLAGDIVSEQEDLAIEVLANPPATNNGSSTLLISSAPPAHLQQQLFKATAPEPVPLASKSKKKKKRKKVTNYKKSHLHEKKRKASEAFKTKKRSNLKKGGSRKRKLNDKRKQLKDFKEFRGSTRGSKGAKGAGLRGAKKGALFYKDKGYKKRGFKKNYQKFETGDHKTYFDEFRDKDHSKKWKDFKDKHHYSQHKNWSGKDKKKYSNFARKELQDKKYGKGSWKEKAKSDFRKDYKRKKELEREKKTKKKRKKKKKMKLTHYE